MLNASNHRDFYGEELKPSAGTNLLRRFAEQNLVFHGSCDYLAATMEGARADKWLWATRFFKTRPDAAEACELGKVKRGGHLVKPATPLRINDVIEIPFHEGPGARTMRVKSLIEKRAGAAIAQACYEDLTPAEIYDEWKLAMQRKRDAGGRPTKKERRDIGRIRGFWD